MLYNPNWEKENEPAWRRQLREAADLIDDYGLAKGVREDDEGRFCLHGALAITVAGDISDNRIHCTSVAAKQLYTWLLMHDRSGISIACTHPSWAPGPFYGMANWNNHPATTKEDVVGALRAAAEMEELVC